MGSGYFLLIDSIQFRFDIKVFYYSIVRCISFQVVGAAKYSIHLNACSRDEFPKDGPQRADMTADQAGCLLAE